MARSKMTPERFSEIRRMLELGVPIREIMRTKKATLSSSYLNLWKSWLKKLSQLKEILFL